MSLVSGRHGASVTRARHSGRDDVTVHGGLTGASGGGLGGAEGSDGGGDGGGGDGGGRGADGGAERGAGSTTCVQIVSRKDRRCACHILSDSHE